MITASIVVYKTKEEELNKIVRCSLDSSIHIIFIVDNSPSNIMQGFIEKFNSHRLFYIWGHGNIGYGAAHNLAINKSIKLNSDYHVILNPDIEFQKGSIESLSNFMDKHPEVGSVMPKVIYPDGSIQRLCKLLPTPLDIFARRFFPKSWIAKRNEVYEMHFMGYDKIWNCPNLSGCFMFLRTCILKEIGGFDDRFFMYFEDTDLIRRIHQVSKTVFFPGVTVIHAHRSEHRTNRTLLKISIRSAMLYFNKYGWLFDIDRRKINKDARKIDSFISN